MDLKQVFLKIKFGLKCCCLKICKYFLNRRRCFLGVKIVRYDWSVSGGFQLVK